ncbi:hypothetical protein QTG54_005170 [Skeletonema marinoi]|uniref:Uncharacterized protein n=1 Tax=Skeletonema marinoi TaxID=267567 RepID=A0AAD8YFT2_9STRA|nr:hypothetical protein QTG54_005170 [Skeletonema marinoi]
MAEQQFVTSPRSCSMNDSLARKLSDTSSSESAVVPDESGCGSCIIDFLHLRSHAVDAVVDDNTKKEEANMTDADMIMIINADNFGNTVKPPPPVCQENKYEPPHYPSPLPEDVTSEKPLATTPPPLPQRRGDVLGIFTNEPHSSALSMPALLRYPPESLQQSHLISTTNIDDDAPLLSLNSMSMNHANPNEAMMPQIPRINLQMRHSNEASYRRGSESNHNRLSATQQRMETRQTSSGCVPIQQDSREEDDDKEL